MVDEKPDYDFSRLGIRDDIPEHIYHRSPGISKHALDAINVSPLHYLTEKQNPKPPTPQMVLGSALHCLVLEPERFDDEFIKEPTNKPRKPTAAQINKKGGPTGETLAALEWYAEWEKASEGKTVISDKPGKDEYWEPGDWQTIHNIRDAVRSHETASILLDPDAGVAERSIYWRDKETARLCRSRVDFLNEAHGLAIDLKTAASARYSEFTRAIHRYRYHVQAEMYSAGLRACKWPLKAFVFIAVERVPPYGVGVYVLDSEARRIGFTQWRNDMHTYDQCKRLDEWPSYPPEVREIVLPAYAQRGDFS